jgi:hypothetical protein
VQAQPGQDMRPSLPAAYLGFPLGVLGVWSAVGLSKAPAAPDHPAAEKFLEGGCEEKVTLRCCSIHGPFTPAGLMLRAAVLPLERGDYLAPAGR